MNKNHFFIPFEVTKKEKTILVTLDYLYTLPFDAETGRYPVTDKRKERRE
jgi:hypothetical protein